MLLPPILRPSTCVGGRLSHRCHHQENDLLGGPTVVGNRTRRRKSSEARKVNRGVYKKLLASAFFNATVDGITIEALHPPISN